MILRLSFIGVVFLLLVSVPGCGDPASGTSQETTVGQGHRGHIDVGVSVEINVVLVRIRVWLKIRDVDVLVIKGMDWTSRKIQYVLNDEEHSLTLTEQQADELKEEIESRQ